MSIALSPLASSQCNNPALAMTKIKISSREPPLHKNRFYMELTAQRAIPKNAELTIRYNSVFEVNLELIEY